MTNSNRPLAAVAALAALSLTVTAAAGGENVRAPEYWAWFTIAVPNGTVGPTLAVSDSVPLTFVPTVPSRQRTVRLAAVYVPPRVAETKLSCAGRTSVTMALDDGCGPRLV